MGSRRTRIVVAIRLLVVITLTFGIVLIGRERHPLDLLLSSWVSETGRLQIRRRRTGLVIAAVGDYSWHESWIGSLERGSRSSKPTPRNWDLAVIYYGDNASFTCSDCVLIARDRGPKWAMIHNLLSQEKQFMNLRLSYDAVAFMDDDLNMTTNDLNEFFDLFSRGSFSPWGYAVNQRNGLWLHYTTFVELMAPTFSTRFFEEVARATLKGQYTGWGMDIIWPYLAGWPKDKIAVIDQVCMHHSPRKGRTGLYSIKLPMSERVEWSINLARFGLTEEKAKAAGVAFNKPMVISELSKDIELTDMGGRRQRFEVSETVAASVSITTVLIVSMCLISVFRRKSKLLFRSKFLSRS